MAKQNEISNETVGYRRNSSGYIVKKIQKVLGCDADGVFGVNTESAVKAFQSGKNLAVTGVFGAKEFSVSESDGESFGIAPSEFERCMNLIGVFEGTGFGGCNITDIDGAGVTLGIAGFTTAHGEVQELFARFFSIHPEQADALPASKRKALESLIGNQSPASAWNQWFYRRKTVADPDIVAAVKAWGGTANFQRIQLDMAKTKFWNPAVQKAADFGLKTLRARLLFFDTAVQNGGWRKPHQVVAARMPLWISGNESQKLQAAALVVAACAKDVWQQDVLRRKQTIVRGSGTVHGRVFNLKDYWL